MSNMRTIRITGKGQIKVHPDMMRITITLEGLRTFKVRSRRYRNRRIGEFLKELHLTEGRNTGFKKILDALKKNGSPLPEFETDEAHDYFITRLFVREGFYNYQGSTTEETTPETTLETTREKLIRVIIENPTATTNELAEKTGLTKDGVKYHLKKLRNDGILTREGSTKRGKWVIL